MLPLMGKMNCCRLGDLRFVCGMGRDFLTSPFHLLRDCPPPRYAIHCCMKGVPLSSASYQNLTNLLIPLYGRTGPGRVELSHTYKYVLLIFYVTRTVPVVLQYIIIQYIQSVVHHL